MRNRFLPILLTLMFIIGAAPPPTPTQAAAFTVTRTDDPPPDGCQPTDCSLREAIIAANISAGADTITIPADTFTLSIAGDNENAAATGDLDITGDLMIIGAGATGTTSTTIDGNDIDQVFEVAQNISVDMSGLIVTGGGSGGFFGNASIVNAGTLTLTNVVVTGNTGSGIVNEGILTLTEGVITKNVSTFGGGIFNAGVLTLVDVVISENEATGVAFTNSPGFGGGVLNFGSLTIMDSFFSKNSASDSNGQATSIGGAIDNQGMVTISGTAFDGNQAESGGAIHNREAGTITFTDVTFTANSASGNGGDSSVSDGGGAILNDKGTLTLEHSILNGNSSGADGGGILNDTGTITITTSSIYSNTSATAGGGIYNLNHDFAQGVVTLSNSTLSGNSAGESGGGIFNDRFGATINLSHVTVTNNTTDSDNNGSGNGGGIFNTPGVSFPKIIRSGTVNLAGTMLAGNFDRGGEASDCGGGQLNSQGYNLIQNVTGCTLGGDTTGNLIGVDPLLSTYADNGGPTLTHLPQVGSLAIDASNPTDCPAIDQRGFSRPIDGDGNGAAVCDIGAVEFGGIGEQYIYLPLVIR